MVSLVHRALTLIILLVAVGNVCVATPSSKTLVARQVLTAPTIDGQASESVWNSAEQILTTEAIGGGAIGLRAVYTADELFILVEFADRSENRLHKVLTWDHEKELYKAGPEREDTFVFKWCMQPDLDDFSLSAVTPYRADIWYWKAHRTDPTGFADDKSHVYDLVKRNQARPMIAKDGRLFFLQRPADTGTSAYKSIVPDTFVGERLGKYAHAPPSGSRADVRARGQWRDGRWTVEFARKLDTQQIDDIGFETQNSYNFGISRFEMAGRVPDLRAEQSSHGAGDIGDVLTLVFD